MTTIGHSYFSPLRLDGDISSFSSLVNQGVVTIPDAPGLGIEIDRDQLAKYTVSTTVIE